MAKAACAQSGEMEKRIHEQQLDLFADRTSAHELWANFSTIAGVVIAIIRRFKLTGTKLERCWAGTIRDKLLEIAGLIRVTTRRVWISPASAYTWQSLFRGGARRLVAAKRLPPAPV